jgi:LPPG:FO 2-phospho-L-lactate transferase
LRELGGDDWFNLGDGDLAVHVERTRRLRSGDRLTDITSDFCRASGVPCEVLPMSDQPVRTIVDTIDGPLPFQDYFVRLQCEPRIQGITFAGADHAQPPPEVLSALRDPRLRAVIICPSNPLISIDPILSVPGLRRAIAECPAPVVAVSPSVDGRALKGPTAKMLKELGVSASAASVADHYADLLDAFVVEATDRPDAVGAGSSCEWHVAKTIMQTMADREDLARAVLLIADQVRPKSIQRKVTAQ